MAETWRLELLDAHERYKADLGQVVGGTLQWSAFRAVQGSGSVQLTRAVRIDPLNDRVRIVHSLDGRETPMGVWMLALDGSTTDGPVTQQELTLADKTHIPNRSTTGQWWNMWPGRVVTTWVQGLLWELGERAFAIEHATDTVASSMHWDHDATWLEIINDVLRSIGYGSLWADRFGHYRAEPYVEPGRRPVTASYGSDARAMRPSWEDRAPLDIPNVFAYFVPGDEETPGYWVHARNDNPDSPFSVPSRAKYPGRRYGEIVQAEQGEASSREAAQAIANRRLAEVSQVTRRATITHPVDDTWPGDVVHHGPLDLTGPIVSRTVTLGIGAVVEDTIRHIYTGGGAPWLS